MSATSCQVAETMVGEEHTPQTLASWVPAAVEPAEDFVKIIKTRSVQYAIIDLKTVTRISLIAEPESRGSLAEQIKDVFQRIQSVLQQQRHPQTPTFQTVFLKNPGDQADCNRLLADHYGAEMPVTTYVFQPPCSGAALAVELWSIGGDSVRIRRPTPQVLSVSYDDLTWTYCGGITPRRTAGGVYEQSLDAFEQMREQLAKAGVGFDHVVRTWLYLGDITGPEGDLERYMELNRARADFYQNIAFGNGHLLNDVRLSMYPASTGIGMSNKGIVMSCTAMDTTRKDVFLTPLENPQQTPVYQYETCYSPKSPKFVRAMALIINGYTTLWISGTASIVNSQSVHIGDPGKQTEQTIANIERLISAENLARHGIKGARPGLSDFARLRVYIKRPQDYTICRQICEKRFGNIPILYTLSDVCRSDLLVEMEGVVFVKRASVD